MSAYGNKDHFVATVFYFLDSHILTDCYACSEFYPHVPYIVNLGIKDVSGKPILRNTHPQHASKL